jgi:hypothetical protein
MTVSFCRFKPMWRTRVRVMWCDWRPWLQSNWWFWYRDHELIVLGMGPVSVFVDLVSA